MGLDTVELILAIEDEFGIRISNQVGETLRTPGDVADYVMTCARTEAYRSREQVLSTIMRLTSRQLDIPIEKIREDSTFVDELGAD